MAKILTWNDMPIGVTKGSPISKCPTLGMVQSAIESGYQLSSYTPSGAISSQLLTSVDVSQEGKILHIICDGSIPRYTGNYPIYSIILRWNDDPDSNNGIRYTEYFIDQNETIDVVLPDSADPSEYDIWACCRQNTSSISRSGASISLNWMSNMLTGPCILDRGDASLYPSSSEDMHPYNYYDCGSAYTENDSDYYLWLSSPDIDQMSANFINETDGRLIISLEDGQLEYTIDSGSNLMISYEEASSSIGSSPYFSIRYDSSPLSYQFRFTFEDSNNDVPGAGDWTRIIDANTEGSTYYLSDFVRYSSRNIRIDSY